MDADEQVAMFPVGELCAVADTVPDRLTVAGQLIRCPGINNPQIGIFLVHRFSQFERDAERNVLLLAVQSMRTGINSAVARIDDDRVERH
jgi:hypothetical protein